MIGEMPAKRTRLSVIKPSDHPGVTWRLATSDIFSFHAHWLGKRSFMCAAPGCAACDQHIGAKWIGLAMVYATEDGKRLTARGLIELTEASYHRLYEAAQGIGQQIEEGLLFRCTRRHRRAPLAFEATGIANDTSPENSIAQARVLTDAVATLYNLPSLAPKETIPTWADRVEESVRSQMRRALQTLLD